MAEVGFGYAVFALGETFIQVMSMTYQGEFSADNLNSEYGHRVVSDIFNEQAREARENIKDVISGLPSLRDK